MDMYTLPNANDFEVLGQHVEGGRFDIFKIVDIDRKECFLFNGASLTDYANRCDNHFLDSLSLTIKDDAFLKVTNKLKYQLPQMLVNPHPFVECDNFYVRNVLTTMLIAFKNSQDGMDNTLEPERSILDDLGLDIDI